MRLRAFHVTWNNQHPDRDYCDPDGWMAVLARGSNDAREAVAQLVGPKGWELYPGWPDDTIVRHRDRSKVARVPFPLGMTALVSVNGDEVALFLPAGRHGWERAVQDVEVAW